MNRRWVDSLWARVPEADKHTVDRFLAEVPVRVGSLAEALGLRVYLGGLSPRISGKIMPRPGGGYDIIVNKYDSIQRQRFTIAHEIAHYLLHRDQIGGGVTDSALYRSSLGSLRETEANRLAGEILLPRHQLKCELAKTAHLGIEERVSSIVHIFNVSEAAAKIALESNRDAGWS